MEVIIAFLYLALPINGLIYLGIRRERQRQEALLKFAVRAIRIRR